jgi:hypothetical protein
MNARFNGNTAGSVAFTTAVATCLFGFLLPVFHADGALKPVCLAVAGALIVEMNRRTIIGGLVKRASRKTGTSARQAVYINGVRVGEIREADAIAIKLEALRDPRNYVAQFANIIAFMCHGAAASLVLMPLLLFWLALFCAWTAPETFQTAISAMVHLQPGDLANIATTLILLSQIAFVIAVGLSFVFGFDLGLENVFRRAAHREIRLTIDCATDGEMTLRAPSASLALA